MLRRLWAKWKDQRLRRRILASRADGYEYAVNMLAKQGASCYTELYFMSDGLFIESPTSKAFDEGVRNALKEFDSVRFHDMP